MVYPLPQRIKVSYFEVKQSTRSLQNLFIYTSILFIREKIVNIIWTTKVHRLRVRDFSCSVCQCIGVPNVHKVKKVTTCSGQRICAEMRSFGWEPLCRYTLTITHITKINRPRPYTFPFMHAAQEIKRWMVGRYWNKSDPALSVVGHESGFQRDRNLWSCEDQKEYFPEDQCFWAYLPKNKDLLCHNAAINAKPPPVQGRWG